MENSLENNLINSTNHPKESDNYYEIDINHYTTALRAIQASFLPMVLHAAVELNVFAILSKAGHTDGLTVEEITGQLSGCRNPDAPLLLDRMLRLLASHSLVSCTICPNNNNNNNKGGFEKRFGLSQSSKFFVGDENGASLGPVLALYIDPVIQASWYKLKDAIIEGGIPFNKVHGMDAYEYPKIDKRFNKVFNDAMFKQPSYNIANLLQKHNIFQGINTLVDVGGGLGHMLTIILSIYPTIQAFNFDLPHVISHAPPSHGVQHIGGDMFEAVPQADAVLMKWVLQVWDDEKCIKVLKNCYKSTPNNKGKVIIIEEIVPHPPETTSISKVVNEIDAYLMIKNPGGRLRTFEEFVTLAKFSGFNNVKFIGNIAELSVIEFFK